VILRAKPDWGVSGEQSQQVSMGGEIGGVKGCVEKSTRRPDDSPLNDCGVSNRDFRVCVIHSLDANNCLSEIEFKFAINRA